MLCRQLGSEMSGQFAWLNEGAAWSLLVSPVKVKLSCCPVAPVLELDGRNKVQGTGTSFSPVVELVELVEP
jgi:hypothetical protein